MDCLFVEDVGLLTADIIQKADASSGTAHLYEYAGLTNGQQSLPALVMDALKEPCQASIHVYTVQGQSRPIMHLTLPSWIKNKQASELDQNKLSDLCLCFYRIYQEFLLKAGNHFQVLAIPVFVTEAQCPVLLLTYFLIRQKNRVSFNIQTHFRKSNFSTSIRSQI